MAWVEAWGWPTLGAGGKARMYPIITSNMNMIERVYEKKLEFLNGCAMNPGETETPFVSDHRKEE
jgi:hypothetical protein